MKNENEMTEINTYIAKIYAITKPEKAKKIVENAKKKSKTSGLSYKEVLSEEFINLLDGPEKEDNKNIMKINFNGKIEDISMMLLSAERYALGRQTYIVQWTCEVIGGNTHLLTTKDLKVMIRDIEQCNNYGWDCDEKEWLELLDILKLVLLKREENNGRENKQKNK